MGMYKYLRKALRNKNSLKGIFKERFIIWRKEPSQIRIEHPTNLITARSLGYRAKKGFVLTRIRIKRGGKQRPQIKKGRRPKHTSQRLILKKSYQWMAEERVARNHPNMEVLNSYKVGEDGKHYWFEVILVDPESPSIISDPKINWICSSKHRGRVFRGLTSAGRKSRGLRGKGRGSEKVRPSLGSHSHRAK